MAGEIRVQGDLDDFARSALQTLNELRLNNELCDVIVRVKTVVFPCHKVVLCTRSAPLRTAMNELDLNQHMPLLDLRNEELEPSAFKTLLEYMYTGVLRFSGVEATLKVLQCAHVLQMKEPLLLCEDYVLSEMKPSNALELWRLGGDLGMNNLEVTALKLASSEFGAVVEAESFTNFSHGHFLVTFLEETLSVDYEGEVLQAIDRWVEAGNKPEDSAIIAVEASAATGVKQGLGPQNRRENELSSLYECVNLLALDHVTLHDHFVSNTRLSGILRYPKLPEPSRKPSRIRSAPMDDSDDANNDAKLQAPAEKSRKASAVSTVSDGVSVGHGDEGEFWVKVKLAQKYHSSPPDQREKIASQLINIHDVRRSPSFDFFMVCQPKGKAIHYISRFDNAAQEWRRLSDVPGSREGAGAGILYQHLYMVGGISSSGDACTSVERCNLFGWKQPIGTWESVKPLPIRISHCAIATLHGLLFVMGGIRDFVQFFDSFYYYSPSSDEWEELPSMTQRRGSPSACVHSGKIFVFGGISSKGVVGSVEAYFPDEKKWKPCKSMPTPRTNAAAAAIGDYIYVIGGCSKGMTPSDIVERYDVQNDSWCTLNPLNYARPQCSVGVIQSSNLMYVVGGAENGEAEYLEGGGTFWEEDEIGRRSPGEKVLCVNR